MIYRYDEKEGAAEDGSLGDTNGDWKRVREMTIITDHQVQYIWS